MPAIEISGSLTAMTISMAASASALEILPSSRCMATIDAASSAGEVPELPTISLNLRSRPVSERLVTRMRRSGAGSSDVVVVRRIQHPCAHPGSGRIARKRVQECKRVAHGGIDACEIRWRQLVLRTRDDQGGEGKSNHRQGSSHPLHVTFARGEGIAWTSV